MSSEDVAAIRTAMAWWNLLCFMAGWPPARPLQQIVCKAHGRTIAEGCRECLSDDDWTLREV